jgi:hypothetical protein
MPVRINRQFGDVGFHQVLRVFRSGIGDWCCEFIGTDGRNYSQVFDYHPTLGVLRLLKKQGANIADDVIDQGAEGLDIGRHGD